MRAYKHIFFDLDHTLWDFDTNAKNTLTDLYHEFELKEKVRPISMIFTTSTFIITSSYGTASRKALSVPMT
jgi:FMN phosphatase YigB (HAD superfamily)